MNNPWKQIDINCDLGEGIGIEQAIMPLIHSCNIACGGHFGDETSFIETARNAVDHGLKLGLHPSYPDKLNFGRKSLVLKDDLLIDTLKQQLDLGLNIAEKLNVKINHIKLHGALYNDVAKNGRLSILIIDLLRTFHQPFKIYAQPGSKFIELAQPHFMVVPEAFIDRNYNSDGTLVRRSEDNALITQPKTAWEHLEIMVEEAKVKVDEGHFIPIKANTFCIHGDNEQAIPILKEIQAQMTLKK